MKANILIEVVGAASVFVCAAFADERVGDAAANAPVETDGGMPNAAKHETSATANPTFAAPQPRGRTQTLWDMKALARPPKTYPAPRFEEHEKKGVKALFYEGLPWHGKKTRVFAWYGVPRNEPNDRGGKFPGMVLVHGGGGTAFVEWAELWRQRGCAAIAMDTCGCVPVGSYGNWNRHDFGGPPGWGGFNQIDEELTDQWTYHAIADVILAHSLLLSFPETDAERTGITGISWGGYLTCIVSGVDLRFKCSVPVYGCGYLGEDSAWLPDFRRMGRRKAEKWLLSWDPSQYLPYAKTPMLWVDGTNDFAYPLSSVQKSYRTAPGPRSLATRVRMPHGHGGPGEKPEEIHAFVNSILKGGIPLAKVVDRGAGGGEVWATFESKARIVKADLNFTRDAGRWQDRNWDTIPAQVDEAAKKVKAQLPNGAKVYFLNLIDERGLIVSTEHVEVTLGQASLFSK